MESKANLSEYEKVHKSFLEAQETVKKKEEQLKKAKDKVKVLEDKLNSIESKNILELVKGSGFNREELEAILDMAKEDKEEGKESEDEEK